jgi:hypothetical protein
MTTVLSKAAINPDPGRPMKKRALLVGIEKNI